MHIGRSRSSKVVDFGTNRNGVCDFLLVFNRGGSRKKYLGGLAPRPVCRNVVECRRHTNGGAEGVDGGGVWGGISPSPVGVGSGALPRKISGIFSFEMVHFHAFWSMFLTFLGEGFNPRNPSKYGPAGPSSFGRQQRLSEI